MDGNGRWAVARGLPRTAGHAAGVDAVRRVVEAAPAGGISTLTLFAFSADNWRRPAQEVDALMRLLALYLDSETSRCAAEGVRVEAIGRRDRLDPALRSAIARAESETASGRRLHLRVALDYSARAAILAAARFLAAHGAPGDMAAALFHYNNSRAYVTAVRDYARRMQQDPHAYAGYYGWQVIYAYDDRTVLLPLGFPAARPIPLTPGLTAVPGVG